MREPHHIPRRLETIVAAALTEARVVAILGPRQAGKSTLVQMIAAGVHPARYVTLDDMTARAEARANPDGFLADKGAPLVIDEIQRAPELMLAIKQRVDRDPARGQYLITGSADLVSLASIPDALPGRVDYLDLWPLAQAEIVGTSVSFIDRLFGDDPPRLSGAPIGRSAYVDAVVRGGYPEAVTRSEIGRARFLGGLVRSTLASDAASVWNGDTELTRRVLDAVAASPAGLVNHAALARRVGASDHSVRAHLAALEEMFIVRRHRPWFSNEGKRLVKSAKAYVTDSGLLCSLLRYDRERIVDDGDAAGPVFETFVAMELVRHAAWDPWGVRVLHMRDEHGGEVDIVLERGDGSIVGIEVKSGASVTRGDLRGLQRLRGMAGDKWRSGVVLYCGTDTIDFGASVWALPIAALWTP